MQFRDRLILAPMVRCGSLPMRLLSLRYGADIVYSPEFVDKKIVQCTRHVENDGKIVCYRDDKGSVIFKTVPEEKPYLVFQLGAATPEGAVAAAKLVESDVSAVDLNCGCPKKFSVHSGMGAALLSDPTRLCSILKALKDNLAVPVTCKIRILPSIDDTLTLVKAISETGVDALAVHCRTRQEGPSDKPHHEVFAAIAECLRESRIPLIANGDVFDPQTIALLRESGVTSFMAARSPLRCPFVFSTLKLAHPDLSRGLAVSGKSTDLLVFNQSYSLDDAERVLCPSRDLCFPTCYKSLTRTPLAILEDYVRIALVCAMPVGNVKFTLCSMRDGKSLVDLFLKVPRCKTHLQLAELFQLVPFYNSLLKIAYYREFYSSSQLKRKDSGLASPPNKKRTLTSSVKVEPKAIGNQEEICVEFPYVPRVSEIYT